MDMEPICYVFGAGEHFVAPPDVSSHDIIIAADGGYNYLKKFHIKPDLLIGDFDSLNGPLPENIDTTILPKEKDVTDMGAALDIGFRRGFRLFHIYGGTGGRLDHTLANIQCLARLAKLGARGFLYDKDTIITTISEGCITFPAHQRGTLSVFAHSENAIGVCEKGLKYNLNDAALKNTYPLGISNEFMGVESSVSVANGTLIIIYSSQKKL